MSRRSSRAAQKAQGESKKWRVLYGIDAIRFKEHVLSIALPSGRYRAWSWRPLGQFALSILEGVLPEEMAELWEEGGGPPLDRFVRELRAEADGVFDDYETPTGWPSIAVLSDIQADLELSLPRRVRREVRKESLTTAAATEMWFAASPAALVYLAVVRAIRLGAISRCGLCRKWFRRRKNDYRLSLCPDCQKQPKSARRRQRIKLNPVLREWKRLQARVSRRFERASYARNYTGDQRQEYLLWREKAAADLRLVVSGHLALEEFLKRHDVWPRRTDKSGRSS